jgi:hypothetical protein
VADALLRDDAASWLVWETVENFVGLDVPLVVMAGFDPSGVRNAPKRSWEKQADVRDPLAYMAMTRATHGTVVVEPNAARFARHYAIRAVEGGGYVATGDAALGDVVVVVDASGRPRLWPRTVNLASQGLTAVPPELLEPRRAASLVELNLGANQLTSLPEAVRGMVSLETLYLYRNQLTSLPEEVGGMVSLETLNLYRNQLTSLPEGVRGMVSLETLDLEGNQLTSLPEGVGGMVSLQGLGLAENQLTSLPEGITALTGLKQLNLRGNPLVRPQTPTVEAWLAALAASGCDISR